MEAGPYSTGPFVTVYLISHHIFQVYLYYVQYVSGFSSFFLLYNIPLST